MNEPGAHSEPAGSMRSFPTRRTGLLFAALLVGGAIAWVDSRPTWDDTGISAGVVLLGSGLFTALGVSPVAAALLVSGPLVLVALLAGNTAALLALLVAAVGAVIGFFVRKAIAPATAE